MRSAVPDLRAHVDQLGSVAGRGACTDAERRAMLQVHDELRRQGHDAWVETHWVRPQWAGSLALHALIGVVASLLAPSQPLVALGLAAGAALSYGLELAGRGGILRMLFVRRATQVVLVEPPDRGDRIALLICAGADAPRRGLLFREGVRRTGARLQGLFRGHAPPAPVWVVLALLAVAACGGARQAGVEGIGIGAVQFAPTVLLLLALTAALDVALSALSPSGGEAGAVAVALALHQELTERPPDRLAAGLVIAGAHEAFPYGMQAHLRRERPDPATTVVLEIGSCAGGSPVVSSHLGVLLSLPVHPQLRIAGEAAELPAEVVHHPGGAVAAHRRGIPAIRVRCVDATGIAPRLRTAADVPEAVEAAALAAALQGCVSLVDALDAELSVVD